MTGDPYKYFRIECRQLLDALSSGLLALEATQPTAGAVQELFRAAHTLKGAARIVGHQRIADASHQLEDHLAALRADPTKPVDIQAMLDLLSSVEEELGALLEAADPASTSQHHPDRTTRGSTQRVLVESASVRGEQHAELLTSLREAHSALSHLAELVGAASLTEATQIGSSALRGDLQYWIEVGLREITDSHETASRLYHRPVSDLLPSLELTVRDVASFQRKRVALRMTGGSLRLASDYLARLKPALVQLARNSVAHGIESPGQRRRAGKNEIGSIEIGFKRSGRRLIAFCQDDGQGVSVPAIRQAAEQRGQRTTGLTDNDLLALLSETSISTAERVDQAAGRGVGLELVGSVARELGGQVQISTASGGGTRVELDVPSSAGELDALLVDVSGEPYLLPLDRVRRGQVFDAKLVTSSSGNLTVDLDGARLRLLDLGALHGHETPREGAIVLVVLESTAGAFVARVDRVLEIRTVTPAALPLIHLLDPIVSGVAVMEDGQLVPILDPDALVGGDALCMPKLRREQAVRILVVDDSLTSRSLEQSILESAGYLVDTASSAEEGLLRTASQRYSLCLVDVEMPGMDGFSFIRELRARDDTRDIPAILISSRNSLADRETGRQSGAQDYMAKQDFDQARLLRRIQELTR